MERQTAFGGRQTIFTFHGIEGKCPKRHLLQDVWYFLWTSDACMSGHPDKRDFLEVLRKRNREPRVGKKVGLAEKKYGKARERSGNVERWVLQKEINL